MRLSGRLLLLRTGYGFERDRVVTEVRHLKPTTRAIQVAGDAGIGSWRDSLAINRAYDRLMGINLSVLIVFAPWPFLWMAYSSAPWRSDGGPMPSWSGFLSSGIAGLLFVALAIFAVLWFVQRLRIGGAVMHLFEHGAIAERVRGKLAIFRYSEVSPRYVVWEEPMEHGVRKRVQLWITMPESGYLLCLDGMKENDRATLKTIASALKLPPDPEPIGRLRGRAPAAF